MRLHCSRFFSRAAVIAEPDYAAQGDALLEPEYAVDEFTARRHHRLQRLSEECSEQQL